MVSPIQHPHADAPLSVSSWQQILRYGVDAPSLDNSQPWAFRLRGNGLDLHLDRSRVPDDDTSAHQSLLSCGAVLLNLRITLLHSGRRVVTTETRAGDAVAGLRVVGRAVATPDAARLFGAIPHRRTWRGPFRTEHVGDPLRRLLARAAQAESARLQFLSDPHQRGVAEQLIADRDAERSARHGRPTEVTRRDPGARDGSVLAVLTMTRSTSPVAAGHALQRVLLTAAAHGLSATLHSAVVADPSSRALLADLLVRPGSPMAVLHLGYGGVLPPAPRRDVTDLLLLG